MATIRILLATESLTIGRFHCAPGDARWRRANWIGPQHHVVFPSRSVLIGRDGTEPVLADPNHVVLYDPGQTYHRELVSPDGDIATYVAVSERLVRALLDVPGDRPPRFGRSEVALAPEPLLRLQVLLAAIRRGELDGLEAEEAALGILETILPLPDGERQAPGDRAPRGARGRGRRPTTRRDHDALVLGAKRILAERFAEPLTLAQIGRLVGASPFHLARLFRDSTGSSLHGYREQIRLRRALERLSDRGRDRGGIGFLAAEVGFASHAHFDARFRRTFGQSPSEVRDEVAAARRSSVAAARVDELRTIAKVQGVGRP